MTGWWLVSYVVLWVLLVAVLLVLLVVLRQLGLIYVRTKQSGLRLSEGPEVGELVSSFGEVDLHSGEELMFPDDRFRLNLLVFASPSCDLCKNALAGLGAVCRGRSINPLVLSFGQREVNQMILDLTRGVAHLALNLERHRAIGVKAIPYGIVTSGKGVVLAKRIINHVDDLEDLLEDAERRVDLGRVGVDSVEAVTI